MPLLFTSNILITYGCTVLAGIIFLIAFLAVRVKKPSPKATIIKAAISVMFIFSWLVLSKNFTDIWTQFIGAGLVFGLLGDIWLDLKFCCREGDERFFTYSGFISFAFGHFMYIAAIITGTNGKFNPIAVLSALGVAIVAALVIFFGEKVMQLHYGEYKLISTLYGALLFFTTFLAGFSALFSGLKDNVHIGVIFIGGILFIISDLILSGTYFGEGKNRPVDIVTNHVFYYAAQFVIAACLLFVK